MAYESESNNSRVTANTLALGASIQGQLSSGSDVDYYAVNIGTSGVLNVNFNRANNLPYSNYNIQVENSSGVVLAAYNDATDPEVFSVGVGQAATYYVKVQSASSGYAYADPYLLSTTFQASTPSDVVGNTSSNTLLSVGTSFLSSIDSASDQDFFKVELIAGTSYQFDMNASSLGQEALADSYLALLKANGTVLMVNNDVPSISGSGVVSYSKSSQIVFTAPETGVYFLDASGHTGSTGTYSIAETVLAPDYYIQSVLDQPNIRWNEGNPLGSPVVITYSFPTITPVEYQGYATNFIPFSIDDIVATRQALELIASYTNITFLETSNLSGQIRFGTTYQQGSSAVTIPSILTGHADVSLANNYSPNDYLIPGTEGWQTLLHEIEHALGLKHPGNYNVGSGSAEPPFLPSSQDALQYTIETYNYSGSIFDATPMVFDIAALQYLYGSNVSTGVGSNTYVLQANHLYTIWDGDGIDTVDGSSLTQSITINLNPGSVSYFGFIAVDANLTPCIDIALNCWIENAIGGPSNDKIIGNSLGNIISGRAGDDLIDSGAGDDIITGGQGNDTVDGGPGSDIATYSGIQNQYTVTYSAITNTYEIADSVVNRDGIDSLTNIEYLQFNNGANVAIASLVGINHIPTGTVTITGTATQGQTLTASNTLVDLDGLGTITYQWRSNGAYINDATRSTFTLTKDAVGKSIDVVASYTDLLGTAESVASNMSQVFSALFNLTPNTTYQVTASNIAISGTSGIDTIAFNGLSSNFNIAIASGQATLTDQVGTAGTDSLSNVERLQFTDSMVGLDIGSGQASGEVFRLYQAALNRAPDTTGLGYWIDTMDHGTSLTSMANAFIGSTEFTNLYGAHPSDTAFVVNLYANVLHRTPDPGGQNYWLGQLSHGETRAQVLAEFSESSENIANITPLIAQGVHYQLWH